MMEKVPMTAGGYAALEVELKRRQSEDRPRIIAHIADARSHGDLSENAEYHAAKEEQSHNEGRIAELEDKLARADIIDISKLSGDTVKFGATVTLIDEDTDKKAVWQIVGEPEADAKKGRISITSPLGARADRKEKGHLGRSGGARRRQGLRDHQGGVAVGVARSPHERSDMRGSHPAYRCAHAGYAYVLRRAPSGRYPALAAARLATWRIDSCGRAASAALPRQIRYHCISGICARPVSRIAFSCDCPAGCGHGGVIAGHNNPFAARQIVQVRSYR